MEAHKIAIMKDTRSIHASDLFIKLRSFKIFGKGFLFHKSQIRSFILLSSSVENHPFTLFFTTVEFIRY